MARPNVYTHNTSTIPKNDSRCQAHQGPFAHKGTTEWIQSEWDQPQEVSTIQVYWFDDTGRGECHLPESWQVLYRTAEGGFQAVKSAAPYGVEKDAFNKVTLEPVKTTAVKIEIRLQEQWSAGVQEVIIE